MSQPTKEHWDEIARQMNAIFGHVFLDCDGYQVTTMMVRDGNKLVIQIYVDGLIQGKWCQVVEDVDEFSDVPKRFWRHSRRQVMPAKQLKALEKAFGKRYCRKKGCYKPRFISYPYWTSAKSLIRHLKKYNDCIEVLDKETHDQRLAAKQSQEQSS